MICGSICTNDEGKTVHSEKLSFVGLLDPSTESAAQLRREFEIYRLSSNSSVSIHYQYPSLLAGKLKRESLSDFCIINPEPIVTFVVNKTNSTCYISKQKTRITSTKISLLTFLSLQSNAGTPLG